MNTICIIDIGSNTIKFHTKSNSDTNFINSYNISWNILDKNVNTAYMNEVFDKITHFITDFDEIIAIGTQALRNNSDLEKFIIDSFQKLEISYTTISQEYEAELIKTAVYKDPMHTGLNIINVGGGSIQIIDSLDNVFLYKFGISFLNSEFNLSTSPTERKSDDCIKWLMSQLPSLDGSFIYSGGEKKYLESMGLNFQENKFCTQADFIALHDTMLSQSMEELKKYSPFDPDWMLGSIASNCIVLALMNNSSSKFFLPSDLNISNGVYETLLEGSLNIA